MKHLFLILISFVLYSSSVCAKGVFDEAQSFEVARAVKIGRSTIGVSSNVSNISPPSSGGGLEFTSPCDENCSSCDYRQKTCNSCAIYYYAKPNSPNCTRICDHVTCVAGATKKEYATYCACE